MSFDSEQTWSNVSCITKERADLAGYGVLVIGSADTLAVPVAVDSAAQQFIPFWRNHRIVAMPTESAAWRWLEQAARE